jgi:hypothetical protein
MPPDAKRGPTNLIGEAAGLYRLIVIAGLIWGKEKRRLRAVRAV